MHSLLDPRCVKRAALAAAAVLALSCAAPVAIAPAHAAAERGAATAADTAEARGRAAMRLGNFREAEARFDEAGRLAPSDARLAGLRAEAIFRQARFADAFAAADAAIAKGESYEAWMVRGRVLAIRRAFDEAARSFARAAEAAPDAPEPWSALAGARHAQGDEPGARTAWEELARRAPREAEDLLWDDLRRMQPDPRQVEELLERCARGSAARYAGRPGEALHEFRAVVGTEPRYGHCWSEQGKAEQALRRPREAELSFRAALRAYRPEQAPLRADTEALLARLLVETGGDPGEAASLARAAMAVRGERPETLEALATACERSGDAPCAREAWKKVASRTDAPHVLHERAEERLERLGHEGR